MSIDFSSDAGEAEPVNHVVEDVIFGKGFEFWKTMPMAGPHSNRVAAGPVQVHPVMPDRTADHRAARGIVEPIHGAQQRGLPGSRRPDQCRDVIGGNRHGDVADSDSAAERDAHIVQLESRRRGSGDRSSSDVVRSLYAHVFIVSVRGSTCRAVRHLDRLPKRRAATLLAILRTRAAATRNSARAPSDLLQIRIWLQTIDIDHEWQRRDRFRELDVENDWLPIAVNNNGAVSPSARDIASKAPVTMPGRATGNTTFRATVPSCPPIAIPASTSSARTVLNRDLGRACHDRHHEDRQRDGCRDRGELSERDDDERVGEDADRDRRDPRGRPRRCIAMPPRSASASALSRSPTRMPSGIPIRPAMPSMMSEPTIAFEIPPPGMPAGVGRFVKKSDDQAEKPRLAVYPITMTNGMTAMINATPQNQATSALTSFLRREGRLGGASDVSAPRDQPGPGVQDAHATSTSRVVLVTDRTKTGATPFRISALIMSRSTTAMSDSRWNGARASANSFATIDYIVCAGSNSVCGRLLLLPTTIVTAIVSPNARPAARIPAPTMPARAAGRTTRAVACQRVAPIARAPSTCSPGTATITSRQCRHRRQDHDEQHDAGEEEADAERSSLRYERQEAEPLGDRGLDGSLHDRREQ